MSCVITRSPIIERRRFLLIILEQTVWRLYEYSSASIKDHHNPWQLNRRDLEL